MYNGMFKARKFPLEQTVVGSQAGVVLIFSESNGQRGIILVGFSTSRIKTEMIS